MIFNNRAGFCACPGFLLEPNFFSDAAKITQMVKKGKVDQNLILF